MSSNNTLKLEKIAVSSISTAEDIKDTIRVIVDYRVGICPFNVNKCNVADTWLPRCAAEVFQLAQRTEFNWRNALNALMYTM